MFVYTCRQTRTHTHSLHLYPLHKPNQFWLPTFSNIKSNVIDGKYTAVRGALHYILLYILCMAQATEATTELSWAEQNKTANSDPRIEWKRATRRWTTKIVNKQGIHNKSSTFKSNYNIKSIFCLSGMKTTITLFITPLHFSCVCFRLFALSLSHLLTLSILLSHALPTAIAL